MTDTVKIISPIDGSIYAERPIATDDALDAAVERARAAQAEVGGRPSRSAASMCSPCSTR